MKKNKGIRIKLGALAIFITFFKIGMSLLLGNWSCKYKH